MNKVTSSTKIALAVAAALAFSTSAEAAVKTWTGTTSSNWATGTNWGGSAPATGDSLVFTSAVGAGGLTLSDNLMTPATFNVAGITFNAGSGAYIINPGTPGTSGFTLTGNVLNSSTNTQTINDLIATTAVRTFTMTTGGGNLVLGGVVSGAAGGITTAGAGTLTLSATGNSYTGATTVAAGTTLSLTGTLTGGTAITVNGSGILSESAAGGISGASTVTLNGTGTSTLAGVNSYTGVTTVNTGATLSLTGSLTGATAITVAGGTFTESGAGVIGSAAATLTTTGGTATLSGINTYTGTTTVNGGTLNLDFSAATAPTTAINIIKTGNTIALGGGALAVKGGGAAATNTQTFGTTNLTANTASTVSLNLNGGTALNVAMGGITRNGQSSVDFTLPASGVNLTTTAAGGSGGLLGDSNNVAYATANGGATWLAKTGSSPFTLSALSSYSSTYVTGNNVDVTNGDLVSGVTVNTLRFNTASDALTLAGVNIVNTGGILVTGTGTGSSITGGTLTSSTAAAEVIIHDYSTVTIGSVIANANAGATATKLTLTGTGVTTLNGANTFTGATSIDKGTVKAGFAQNGTTSGTFGGQNNSLTISGGAILDLNGNNVGVGAFLAGTNLGTVTNSSGTLATLTVGNNNSRWTGINSGITLSGNLALVVTGNNGTRDDMGGANTHTGGTTFTGNNTSDRWTNGLVFGSGTITLGGSNGIGGVVVPSAGISNTTLANSFQVVGGTLTAANQWNVQTSQGFSSTSTWTGTGVVQVTNGFNPTFTLGGNMTGFQGTLLLNENNTSSNNLSNGTNIGMAQGALTMQSGGTSGVILSYTGGGNVAVGIGDLNTANNAGDANTIIVRNGTNATTATWTVGAKNQTSTFAGEINTNGTALSAVTKVGTGNWTLTNGNSTYTGATTVSGGGLIAGGNAPSAANSVFGNAASAITLGDAATTTNNSSASLLTGGAFTIGRAVTIANQATSGTYSIGGNTDNNSIFSGLVTTSQNLTVSQVATTSTNTLSVTGGITSGNAGTKTVTFANAGAVSVSTTAISDGGSGALAVTQSGAGTTTLFATNTYTGSTAVNNGSLVVTSAGAINASSAITVGTTGVFQYDASTTGQRSGDVTVNTGGTLKGLGYVGNVTVNGGTVAPGDSPGILNTLNFSLATGTLAAEINGNTAGTNYDMINAVGTVTLGGSLTISLGFTPANGDLFFLVNNDGTDAVSGLLNGAAQGSVVTLAGQVFVIGYTGDFSGGGSFTGGNDVVLQAIPEPSSWGMIAASLGLFFVVNRKRGNREG